MQCTLERNQKQEPESLLAVISIIVIDHRRFVKPRLKISYICTVEMDFSESPKITDERWVVGE